MFIAPLVPEDVERVSALAAGIWRTHYPGIISAAQIEYMLAQRYDPRVMREELQRDDVWWDKLLAGNEIIGFSSYFRGAVVKDIGGGFVMDDYIMERPVMGDGVMG